MAKPDLIEAGAVERAGFEHAEIGRDPECLLGLLGGERGERERKAGGRAEMQRRGAQLMQGGARQAAAERRIDLGHAERERAHLLGQRLAFGDGAPQTRKVLLHVGREHGEAQCS